MQGRKDHGTFCLRFPVCVCVCVCKDPNTHNWSSIADKWWCHYTGQYRSGISLLYLWLCYTWGCSNPWIAQFCFLTVVPWYTIQNSSYSSVVDPAVQIIHPVSDSRWLCGRLQKKYINWDVNIKNNFLSQSMTSSYHICCHTLQMQRVSVSRPI